MEVVSSFNVSEELSVTDICTLETGHTCENKHKCVFFFFVPIHGSAKHGDLPYSVCPWWLQGLAPLLHDPEQIKLEEMDGWMEIMCKLSVNMLHGSRLAAEKQLCTTGFLFLQYNPTDIWTVLQIITNAKPSSFTRI